MRIARTTVLGFLFFLGVSQVFSRTIVFAQTPETPASSQLSSAQTNANTSSELPAKGKGIRDEYLKGIDKTLDASLAATLAGLALAAAAFLLPLQQWIRMTLPPKQVGSIIEQTENATKSMVWAFYFFVVALVDSILIDPLTDLQGEMSAASIANLAVAGGGIVTGIAFMVKGARLIRKIVSPGKLEGETDDN